MAKKFKYLHLSALYHLMDGLSFDVAACADVLEAALVQLNLQTGVPDSIVQWNRRGGHEGGPLKIAGQGGIAIEVSETIRFNKVRCFALAIGECFVPYDDLKLRAVDCPAAHRIEQGVAGRDGGWIIARAANGPNIHINENARR